MDINLINKLECLEAENKDLKAEIIRLNDKIKSIEKERDRAKYEISETRKSISFRVGHVLTYIPRKLRGME